MLAKQMTEKHFFFFFFFYFTVQNASISRCFLYVCFIFLTFWLRLRLFFSPSIPVVFPIHMKQFNKVNQVTYFSLILLQLPSQCEKNKTKQNKRTGKKDHLSPQKEHHQNNLRLSFILLFQHQKGNRMKRRGKKIKNFKKRQMLILLVSAMLISPCPRSLRFFFFLLFFFLSSSF